MGKITNLEDHRMAKACELASKMLDEYDPVYITEVNNFGNLLKNTAQRLADEVDREMMALFSGSALVCPECEHANEKDPYRDDMITCDKCGVTFRTVAPFMGGIE